MYLALVLAVTVGCNLAVFCQDAAPESAFDLPACSDYEHVTALIASMEGGDRSALELLRSRYPGATTWDEKHRIAAALLRKVPDDGVYWDELIEHARNLVYAGTDAEYVPSEYSEMAYGALLAVSKDRRSHALLLEALGRDDSILVDAAIRGLAAQHDLNALPAIERALERCRERDEYCAEAYLLVGYADERADELARRFLDDGPFKSYLELRNAPPEEE